MTDQEYNWQETRDRAAVDFGDYPSGQLEQELIDHWQANPERVVRTIDRIRRQHKTKPFNSPWAVIRKDLSLKPAIDETHVKADLIRQTLIDRAKTWVRNAGCNLDTWAECETALFGTGATTAPLAYLEQLEQTTRDNPGRKQYDALLKAAITRTKLVGQEPVPDDTSAQLYELRNDQDAHDQLKAEYQTHRPRAEQAEADFQDWNLKAKENWERILEIKRRQKQLAQLGFHQPSQSPADQDINWDETPIATSETHA